MSAPERGPRGTWQHLAWWADGAIALNATQASLVSSDLEAAALLAGERGGNGLHYAVTSKQWHVWTGQAHPPDMSGEIEKMVINLAIRLKQMIYEARGAVEAAVVQRLELDGAKEATVKAERKRAWEPWEKAASYAAGLAKSAGRSSLVSYLAAQLGVSDEYMIERRPGDLNFPNGTLDLASLVMRPHSQADMITYVLKDPWNPQAQCPRFWDLIYRMTGRDYEVSCYVIKLLGYSLLGDNREQRVIFINGPTGSGKSLLLHVVSEVLGPLAHRSGAELITVVRGGLRNARTENSIRGKRLITITETSKFMSVDEAQLKQLTGEAVISVNQHYAKTEIKTPVTWTIWVATNDMPNLVHFDGAMRRRIIVIPGGPTIPDLEMDPNLAAKILSTESQGILALLARGCAEYHRVKLGNMPGAVLEATEEYAAEQNTVANFLNDTTVLGGYSLNGGIAQHQAWEGYVKWTQGTRGLGRNEFMKALGAHPDVNWNKTSRRFEGLAWNQDWATRVY